MKRWTRPLLILLFLGAVAAPVLYWQWPRETIEAVTVIEATLGTIQQTIVATGSVEARRKVLVTVDPGSRIAALYFNEQDVVVKDQILAKLDDLELVTHLRQAKTGLNLARSNLAHAESVLAQTKSLFDKGYLARQEVDAAERQVDLFRSQIDEKQAAIALLTGKIERSYVRAPISGAVTRKLVEVGGVVSDGARGFQGGSGGPLQPIGIAEIAHLEALEVHVDVDQTEIGLIKRGQRAVILLDAFPDRQFTGNVADITLSSVEEMGGRVRYKVRVELQKTDVPLRLGMTGTVDFILAQKDQVLTVPSSVVLQRGGEDYVFVVEEGRAHLRSLRTGVRGEDLVEIVAGLRAGELVIDQGRGRVKDGQVVDAVNGRR